MPPSLANLIPVSRGAACRRQEDSPNYYLDAVERRLVEAASRIDPPEVPEPFDLGASVVWIAALTVRMSLLTDSAGATPDLALWAIGLESRNQVAADLAREQEALTRAFRDLRSWP